MKFKIDENLPVEVADLLRRSDHDAATVLEEELGGSADFDIALICRQAIILACLKVGATYQRYAFSLESASIRRLTKARKVFPNLLPATTTLYLAGDWKTFA